MIPAIVERHAEDAAFLWLRRENAVHAPHFRLAHLVELDERVEAHVDGLRLAGEHGWRAAEAQLHFREPGEVFTAALLAFARGDAERIVRVLELAEGDPLLARATASALGWSDEATLRGISLDWLTNAQSPALRRVGLAAYAIRRLDPGAALAGALHDPAPGLRARALRAVGQLGRSDLLGVVVEGLGDDDGECRFAAAWSATLLGSAGGIPPLVEAARAGGRRVPAAAGLAVRRMSHADARDWIADLSAAPQTARTAILAIGAFGDPGFVPWLLQAMHEPSLARVAGEAFGMIMGIDLAEEHLDGATPRGAPLGPNDDPDDHDVALHPDHDLAWPLVEVVHAYWARHEDELLRGTRYLMGRPIVPAFLTHVLAYGMQRQRAAAALELSARSPGRPLYEVRAPGFRQRRS